MMLHNSKEYEHRVQTAFRAPNITRESIRAAVPNRLFSRSTSLGLYYVLRTILCSIVLFLLALKIDKIAFLDGHILLACKTIFWLTYWWFQGIIWAGFWCLAHEASHGNLSPNKNINDTIGLVLHSLLLAPYHAWKITHHAHHKNSGHMTRDENYVPYTRSDYRLPPKSIATKKDYQELLEDSPLYALVKTLLMQFLGLVMYFTLNAMGSPVYPPGTNHFNPASPLFSKKQYKLIVVSDIGVGMMFGLLVWMGAKWGAMEIIKHYAIPFLLVNNWIVLVTYLQHTDPTIPHYRDSEWTFMRGALATVDRPVMGWIGRFFFMNISHDHVAHHLFYTVPFYNLPEVTDIIRELLSQDYMYDSTNCFFAFYRSLDKCRFVEDSGGIVMYKDAQGHLTRPLDGDVDDADAWVDEVR